MATVEVLFVMFILAINTIALVVFLVGKVYRLVKPPKEKSDTELLDELDAVMNELREIILKKN